MKKKIFIILLVLVLINLYKLSLNTYSIPNTSIRLRIIPNSNSQEDIYMKEQVKSYIKDNLYSKTKNSKTIEETRTIINNNIDNLNNDINNLFISNNYNLPFNLNFGYNYFPEKEFKGTTYKEGYYESLVISIGDSNGDNFWCVLFPNFCLIDTDEEHTYKSYFKELYHKIKKEE